MSPESSSQKLLPAPRRGRRSTYLLGGITLITLVGIATAGYGIVAGDRVEELHGDGWERYVHAERGFSFRYPEGWRVETSAGNAHSPFRVTLWSYPEDKEMPPNYFGDETKIDIFVDIDHVDEALIPDWLEGEWIIETREIEVNGQPALVVEHNSGESFAGASTRDIFYFDSETGRAVQFRQYPFDTEYLQTFEDIVSSFRFTE